MRIFLLFAITVSAFFALIAQSADPTNTPKASPAVQEKIRNRALLSRPPQLKSGDTSQPPAAVRGQPGDNQPPGQLRSAEAANKVDTSQRVPVYVIPELIEVRVPGGARFLFVEQHHMQELAKKFPAIRYTNIVIYNDGL